jgi:histone deacetylase complex regulatory component SIN3
MKKRVDEIQNFHSAPRVAPSTARIITPPQHNSSPNATQSQFQILNVLRDATPTQSVQYTTYSAITPTSIQRNNVTAQQQQQPQPQNQSVQVVTAAAITNPVRPKPAASSASGSITPTPVTVTSPTGNSIPVQNAGGQNFPRLKVEDALSYLDQVRHM